MLATPIARARGTGIAERIDLFDFSSLREEWDELLRDSDADCLFLTWEWMYSWWKHLAGDRRLAIIAARNDDGRLIGIAPFAVRGRDLAHGHPFEVQEFLGSGHVGSDYLDLIVRRGEEREAIDLLVEPLARQRSMYKWTNLSVNNQLTNAASRMASLGWSRGTAVTNVCPYIPLAGKTWQSYLSELGSEHRYNFHRRLRQMNRDFTVTFERADSHSECMEAIDTLIELHNLRRSTMGGGDAFHTPELVAFHREFVHLAFDLGWLRLYTLRLDDKPVAALYGFLYGAKFYFYQSGFDPAYEKYSPGTIAMGLSIQAAIEDGAEEYDLLHGNEAYKSRWTSQRRDLTRIELYPPSLSGRAFHASIEMLRNYRRVAQGVQRNAR